MDTDKKTMNFPDADGKFNVEFHPEKIKKRKKTVTMIGHTENGEEALFCGALKKEEPKDIFNLKEYAEWNFDFCISESKGEIRGVPELSKFLGLSLQETRTLCINKALPAPIEGWDGNSHKSWRKKDLEKMKKIFRMNRYDLIKELMGKLL